MILEKEYNSWQETNYLLHNPVNRKALAHSINQLDSCQDQHFLTPEEFKKQARDG